MDYKVRLSNKALTDINQTVTYLLRKWSEKEASYFLNKLEKLKELLSKNPAVFQYYNKINAIRKVVLTKHNIVYYQINKRDKIVNIITIFNVFQDPEKFNS